MCCFLSAVATVIIAVVAADVAASSTLLEAIAAIVLQLGLAMILSPGIFHHLALCFMCSLFCKCRYLCYSR